MTTSLTPSAPSSAPSQGPPYKRSVRNYLIDSRFQLRYSGFLVGIALVVSALLGAFLYRTSSQLVAQSDLVVEESKKVSDVVRMSIKDDPVYSQTPELAAAFAQASGDSDKQAEDWHKSLVSHQRAMLASLVGGLALLVLVIGLAGIWITHKIAGPIYKMKRLLRQVGAGKLVFQARLRKGDELQDFFDTFASMVESLRDRQAREVAQLDAALRVAESNPEAREASLEQVKRVRDEMRRALDA